MSKYNFENIEDDTKDKNSLNLNTNSHNISIENIEYNDVCGLCLNIDSKLIFKIIHMIPFLCFLYSLLLIYCLIK